MSGPFLIALVCAAVVLIRCICVIATFSPSQWQTRTLLLMGTSTAYALLSGGAAGIALGLVGSGHVLLAGVACLFIFERRGRAC